MSGEHKTLPPSAAHRWIPCAGSVALEATMPATSSKYADDGTATHILSSRCFEYRRDAVFWLGETIGLGQNGEKVFSIDQARCDRSQMYVNDVLARAKGGHLLFECQVDLSEVLGQADQGGTSDAIILQPDLLTVEDLKDGAGEKVFAEWNPQLMLYALGALRIVVLYGLVPDKVKLVICQPRLDHIDEWEIPTVDLIKWGEEVAKPAAARAAQLKTRVVAMSDLNPGVKQCRWCRAKSKCPALAAKVQADLGAEFATMQAGPGPIPPTAAPDLALAFSVVDLVEDWCSAIRAAVNQRVAGGEQIIGTDGLALKLIEGKRGNREWADERQAEGMLCGQMPPEKVYKPREIVTPAVAEKLLKSKVLWEQVFKPMVRQAPGRPRVVLGSVEGTPWSPGAKASDFDTSPYERTE